MTKLWQGEIRVLKKKGEAQRTGIVVISVVETRVQSRGGHASRTYRSVLLLPVEKTGSVRICFDGVTGRSSSLNFLGHSFQADYSGHVLFRTTENQEKRQ